MIEVKNVSKTFKLSKARQREMGGEFKSKSLTAVDEVSFSCKPGRVFSLLGPNGAGKTTMLRMIATMIRPSSGTVNVAGFDVVKQARDVRRSLGFLTGDTGLYDRLTPAELIRYYANLYELNSDEFNKNRDRLFDLLGINSFAGRRIGKLSSGMKQKVSIARTMIHDPAVLIFDEPTVGLDVITARAIIDLIRDCRTAGKTVIFSTHIMSEVSLLCDDLAIVHQGKLQYSGEFKKFQNEMTSDSIEAEFIRLLEEAA